MKWFFNSLHNVSRRRWLVVLFFLLLLVAYVMLLAQPLWDIDLWWHLATGKELNAQHQLFESDPFNFTTGEGISPERRSLLNYCWLGQLFLYGTYLLGGMYGLIILRVILLAAIPLMTLWFCLHKEIAWQQILPFLLLEAWLTLSFTGERPQLFSFFFFLLLIILLLASGSMGCERPRPQSYRIGYTLYIPPLMLVWSNVHPASILGACAIAIVITGETLKRLRSEETLPLLRFWPQMGILSAGIAATLATPIGISPYLSIFAMEGGRLQSITSEYISPVRLLMEQGNFLPPYWLYVVIFISLLIYLRGRINLSGGLLCLFLFAISLSAYRYIPFFVFGTVPILLLSMEPFKPRPLATLVLKILVPLVASWFALVGIYRGAEQLASIRAEPIQQGRMPVSATDFMERSGISGRLFNHFNWGGYLIWRLYPSHQVFIDGRMLNSRVFEDYTNILWVSDKSKELLNRYSINIVVMPALQPMSGELYGLPTFLTANPEWHLVYQDATAFVMVRGEENAKFIEKFEIAKEKMSDHIFGQAAQLEAKGLEARHLSAARRWALSLRNRITN